MKIDVARREPRQGGIIGTMTVNGFLECWTLENEALCIPIGRYTVEITYSPDFDRELPLIDGVPQRTDIRIHALNFPYQSKGCIGVGQSCGANYLNNSGAALDHLFPQIKKAIDDNELVTIDIH